MEITQEKIELICRLTGVFYFQAETALRETHGVPLDALLLLERQGLIESAGVGRYSTAGALQEPEPFRRRREPEPAPSRPRGAREWARWCWSFLLNNRLEACHRYDPARQIQCPIGVLLALLAIAWYAVVGVLAAGALFGWRYRLAGPQLGKD